VFRTITDDDAEGDEEFFDADEGVRTCPAHLPACSHEKRPAGMAAACDHAWCMPYSVCNHVRGGGHVLVDAAH
jgi:hypothetical protein